MKPVIATLEQLRAVKVAAVDEPLVEPQIAVEYRGGDTTVGRVLVRETVARMLERVDQRLRQQEFSLLVVDGYRSLAWQERWFLEHLVEYVRVHANLTLDTLLECVHQYVAFPSVAGHPTGGAVDVTLLSSSVEVDMGCRIADFSRPELLPTDSTYISMDQQLLRGLLHETMVGEGFASFYGEWWHFSYGDREWAVVCNHLCAIFDSACT